jgi:hypothetical protein
VGTGFSDAQAKALAFDPIQSDRVNSSNAMSAPESFNPAQCATVALGLTGAFDDALDGDALDGDALDGDTVDGLESCASSC